MSNILWQQPDGTLALTTIFPPMDVEVPVLDEAGERIGFKTDPGVPLDPAAHASQLLAQGDVPADWVCLATNVEWHDTGWPHECYRWVDGSVQVDFVAAKEATKARLRNERQPLFAQADLDFMLAIEQGVSTAPAVAEKERLRALTKLVDNCLVLEDLQALRASSVLQP